ncbi:unnamed protein product [Symbiodinium necroappetens]|uniref:Uncharacterized protein n=1 Tax=Symbiodinium necroappetens TaxID=1628268 RepID=A0A812WDE8_9DINO|nr:unnamed protein product [Symbiodinium necroappetens]
MNIAKFLEHWQLSENPFRAEEARHDGVLSRLGVGASAHPDFEKILGEVSRPSTSIVFGEKGSGKTAIRLHIAERVAEHNEANPGARVLFVPYDDLNPMLDGLHEHLASRGKAKKSDRATTAPDRDALKSLEKIELVDHMDAILAIATDQLVTGLLTKPAGGDKASPQAVGPDAAQRLRNAERSVRDDALLLHAVYGRVESAPGRFIDLRRKIGGSRNWAGAKWSLFAYLGWILPAGVIALWASLKEGLLTRDAWLILFAIAFAIWGAFLFKRFVVDPFFMKRLGGQIGAHVRVNPRPAESYAACLSMLPPAARERIALPINRSDEPRYLMLEKLVRVLRASGISGVLVVMDRIDEPTLVNGDANRMRAVIWPMLNNKFLQQSSIGFKLLLPLELRYELLRETSAFFQEARLDKQSLVERLAWTGTMLYDLCTERLNACRQAGTSPMSLLDLFDESVTRQDLIDALDQMQQPRDAFKLVYHCIQEHCSAVPEDASMWKIPRHVLDTTRKQQAERVQAFYRGLRPA